MQQGQTSLGPSQAGTPVLAAPNFWLLGSLARDSPVYAHRAHSTSHSGAASKQSASACDHGRRCWRQRRLLAEREGGGDDEESCARLDAPCCRPSSRQHCSRHSAVRERAGRKTTPPTIKHHGSKPEKHYPSSTDTSSTTSIHSIICAAVAASLFLAPRAHAATAMPLISHLLPLRHRRAN